MMLHVSFISALYQGLLVMLGNAATSRLKAIPMARKIASRVAGMTLVGFGIKLAASNR